MSGLATTELARQAGTTPEGVERLVQLGILEQGDGERPFADRDVHGVRFDEAIRAAGISIGWSRRSSTSPGAASSRCTRTGA